MLNHCPPKKFATLLPKKILEQQFQPFLLATQCQRKIFNPHHLQLYHTVLLFHNYTTLQLYSSTALQLYNSRALQLYNYTALQLYSCTTLQLYNSTAIQTRSRAKCDILFSNIVDKISLLRDFSHKFRFCLDICAQFIPLFPKKILSQENYVNLKSVHNFALFHLIYVCQNSSLLPKNDKQLFQ
jgi:hypothetical protein